MRSATVLVEHPEVRVTAVACRDDHAGWSPAEQTEGYGLVLVRTGVFRRRGTAGPVLVDPTTGYLTVPGEEETFAHPAGGDDCTALHVSPRLWHAVVGEPGRRPAAVPVDAGVELAHRLLRRRAADPDVGFAGVERVLRLLGRAVRAEGDRPGPVPRPADMAAVEAARAAIAAGDPAAAGLLPLAELVGLSPYRLSRVFHRITGRPLTRYRNRVRVSAAMHRLEQGEQSLAGLAAELGFADQAHLTRTVRAHLGHTPAQVRRLLTGLRT